MNRRTYSTLSKYTNISTSQQDFGGLFWLLIGVGQWSTKPLSICMGLGLLGSVWHSPSCTCASCKRKNVFSTSSKNYLSTIILHIYKIYYCTTWFVYLSIYDPLLQPPFAVLNSGLQKWLPHAVTASHYNIWGCSECQRVHVALGYVN